MQLQFISLDPQTHVCCHYIVCDAMPEQTASCSLESLFCDLMRMLSVYYDIDIPGGCRLKSLDLRIRTGGHNQQFHVSTTLTLLLMVPLEFLYILPIALAGVYNVL